MSRIDKILDVLDNPTQDPPTERQVFSASIAAEQECWRCGYRLDNDGPTELCTRCLEAMRTEREQPASDVLTYEQQRIEGLWIEIGWWIFDTNRVTCNRCRNFTISYDQWEACLTDTDDTTSRVLEHIRGCCSPRFDHDLGVHHVAVSIETQPNDIDWAPFVQASEPVMRADAWVALVAALTAAYASRVPRGMPDADD